MISLILSFLVLIVGYSVYGKVVDTLFGPDDRQTPAYAINDGVDCVPMDTWKAFLVQLLNIAGTGPIFGALMGAAFGPVVFLWIIFGSVLGGAVHDYMVGMISSRHSGQSIAELSGYYLGDVARQAMRVFSILLLLLTGTVFITSPAGLLADLTPSISKTTWVIIIVLYYTLATFLPIDKIIGKLYPIFGAVLIIMAVGIVCGLVYHGYKIPEINFTNMHPDMHQPIWPFMFITVACGAISGFHATQSPMIAKCIKSEKDGRKVFYGAMICESVIALVWASAGVAFYGITDGKMCELFNLLIDKAAGPGKVVYDISTGLLGGFGGILAVIGVVVCPITSGDTAFRSVRLILAEWFGIKQDKIEKRLLITIPLLLAGAYLTTINFGVLWRYFSWSNQTLAMISLWVATGYLLANGRGLRGSLFTALPASFMSAVSFTYILMAPEGFSKGASVAYPVGMAFALWCFAFYYMIAIRKEKAEKEAEETAQKQE